MPVDFLLPIFLWILMFITFRYLKTHKKLTLSKNPLVFATLFLPFILVPTWYLQAKYDIVFNYPNLFLSLIFLVLIVIKAVTFKYLHQKYSFKNAFSDSIIFALGVFAQQVLILTLWISLNKDAAFLSLLFVILHLPLLFFLKKFDALIIIISSTFGALFFSYLYNNYTDGLILAFLLHFFFHLSLDLFYLILKREPISDSF